ncbi:MAG: methyltransferase domain-containing protein [Acidobacteria bacterium]|nr:methyltransferase domain-containing protein [Acidobacteriota bacterium]
MIEGPATLRASVHGAYSAAALDPAAKHPFPVGRDFAESVGYPTELLSRLPNSAAAAFAGVSNVAVTAPVEEGMTILDIGCGAGLDSLIAGRRVGAGRVIGIDFSAAMLARALEAARDHGAANVHFVQASAESLPCPDASVDLALVNGIFNLNPFRAAIFHELARVVKPGGRVAGAELIVGDNLPEVLRQGSANWFS